MKIPGLFFALLLGLLWCLYIAYLAWFKSDELSKQRKRGKSRYKTWFPFIPDPILEAFFLPEEIAKWWGRIMSLLVIILLLALMWVAAFGVPIELP